jgi:hypothetical protein
VGLPILVKLRKVRLNGSVGGPESADVEKFPTVPMVSRPK